jgi:hypothetical protein
MMVEEKDFDVVVDVLQKHYDKLLKMTQQNIEMDMFNIMDQIRFEQMSQLSAAIKLWEKHSERTN